MPYGCQVRIVCPSLAVVVVALAPVACSEDGRPLPLGQAAGGPDVGATMAALDLGPGDAGLDQAPPDVPTTASDRVVVRGVNQAGEARACLFDFAKPEAGCVPLAVGTEFVSTILFAPSGRFFLFQVESTGPWRRFDLDAPGFRSGPFMPIDPAVYFGVWSPTGDDAVFGSIDRAIAYSSGDRGTPASAEVMRDSVVYGFRWNRSGTRFVNQSVGGTTRVFDMERFAVVAEFEADGAVSTAWLGDDLMSWEAGRLTRRLEGTGSPTTVRNEEGATLMAPPFTRLYHRNVSPDGARMVVHAADGVVYLVEDTGAVRALFERPAADVTDAVLWSPSGEQLGFTVRDPERRYRFEAWLFRPTRSPFFSLPLADFVQGRFSLGHPSRDTFLVPNEREAWDANYLLVDLGRSPPAVDEVRLGDFGLGAQTYGRGLLFGDGAAPEVLTHDGRRHELDGPLAYGPCFSSDGRWLLAPRIEDGEINVYLVDLDGTGPPRTASVPIVSGLRWLRTVHPDPRAP